MPIDKQRAVAHRLVDAVIATGRPARWDFDDNFTNDADALKRDADACDIQTLQVQGLGWFLLVYGNAEDGSELISDHADNDFCRAIYKEVYADGTD